MIRYIVSLVLVGMLFAFVSYGGTSFVPPTTTPVLLHYWQYNGIDNTAECVRADRAGNSNTVPCTDSSVLLKMPSSGVVTKVIYRMWVQTPTAGIDCDISLRIAGVNVGTVWTLDTEVVGDSVAINQSAPFAAGDLLQLYVEDGAGGTCNQVTDAWIVAQAYGYYGS